MKKKKAKKSDPKEEKLYCSVCKKDFDEHDSIETGCCPTCGGKGEVKKAVPDRTRGKSKGKKKDGPGASKKRVKQSKAGSGNGNEKDHLKYAFDTLAKGEALSIANADGMATPKESRLHNVKVLAREWAARHASSGIKFEVKKTEDGNIECRRVA